MENNITKNILVKSSKQYFQSKTYDLTIFKNFKFKKLQFREIKQKKETKVFR